MGLIIKNEIRKLMKGFPTVSDKYDVQGGVLGGSAAAHFGDVLVFGSEQGEYKPYVAGTSAIADIAGILCGTNVKLATTYPAGPSVEVETQPGEAINMMFKGFIAVELDSGATLASATEGSAVHCIIATGKLTTVDKYSSGTIDPIPGWYFTGVTETIGSTKFAEIVIK